MAGEKTTQLNTRVYMKKSILDKIEIIVSDYKNELGGMIVGKIVNGDIVISNIIFPKQTVGGASVDIDKKDLILCRNEHKKEWENVIGFWHSHVSMGTFWSGEGGDEQHIKAIGDVKDFAVFIVSSFHNDDYQHRVRLEIRKPINMTFDNLPLYVDDEEREKIRDDVLKEVASVVIEPKPVKPTYSSNYNGYWWEKDDRKPKDTINFGKKGDVDYVWVPNQSALIVKNLSYEEAQILVNSEFPTKNSGIDSKSYWWITFNAGNEQIANSLKESVEKHLKEKQSPDINLTYEDFE